MGKQLDDTNENGVSNKPGDNVASATESKPVKATDDDKQDSNELTEKTAAPSKKDSKPPDDAKEDKSYQEGQRFHFTQDGKWYQVEVASGDPIQTEEGVKYTVKYPEGFKYGLPKFDLLVSALQPVYTAGQKLYYTNPQNDGKYKLEVVSGPTPENNYRYELKFIDHSAEPAFFLQVSELLPMAVPIT